VGSLTGFLFQDTRCKCSAKAKPADGEMAKRFSKLKKAGIGNTFNPESTVPSDVSGCASTKIDLLPGAVIGKGYRIQRLIGKGGMGEVYLAEHLTLGKTCALKLIPPDQVTDNSWERFQNEARSIAGLDHINLVKVIDLGLHEGCLPYYVMEYIEGQTLAEMLTANGPMPLNIVLDVFIQVCDGLDYAHRNGIIHRDLKPANIMLSKTQHGKFLAKILDFGLVNLTQRDRHQQSLTAVGEVFGSPFYMSPEQCAGDKIDNRSDIYSIGCTIFECLTGRPPFTSSLAVAILYDHANADPPSLESIAGPKVFPESIEVVLAKLLRKNPVERYQTLLELKGDLERVARGHDVQPFYVSRSQQTKSDGQDNNFAKHESKTLGSDNDRSNDGGKFGSITSIALVSLISLSFLLAGWLWFSRTGGVQRTTAPSVATQTKSTDYDSTILDLPPQLGGKDGLIPKDDRSKQIPTYSLKEHQPLSEIKEIGGVRSRVFHFPTDITIGDILYRQKGKIPADGTMVFGMEEDRDFYPDPILLKYPQYWSRFRPDDLTCIHIESTAGTDEMIKLVCSQPIVKKIQFYRCPDLTLACFPYIEKSPSLRAIQIGKNSLRVEQLAHLSKLRLLPILCFWDQKNSDDLILLVKDSHALKDFSLESSTVSRQGFKYIAQIPNLNILRLDKVKVTPEDLDLLANKNSLKELSLLQCHLDDKILASVRKIKSLKHVMVTDDPTSLLRPAQIRKALPGIEVTWYAYEARYFPM